MGYEQIVVTDELSTSVQRASGIPLRRRQTLGELVKAMAAQRGICGPVDLIAEESTRHEVRVDGRVMYTFCFVDALMLPFVLRGGPVEVRSDRPLRWGSHGARDGGRGRRLTAGCGRLVRRGSNRGWSHPYDAVPVPQRFPVARRLRVLGGADAAGRGCCPLDGGSVRPCAGLDLASRPGFRRRNLPLLSFTSLERREESPCRIS